MRKYNFIGLDGPVPKMRQQITRREAAKLGNASLMQP